MNSEEPNFSRTRQSDKYVGGVSGKSPAVPVSYPKLKAAAEKMSDEAFACITN